MNQPTPLLEALRTFDARSARPRVEAERAAALLTTELSQLAAYPHRTSAGSLRIPPKEQEDLVQQVLYKLLTTSILTSILERTPHLSADPLGLENTCRAYLCAMVRNAYLATLSRSRHTPTPEMEPVAPVAAPTAPAPTAGVLQAASEVLKEAAKSLLQHPGKRNPEELRVSLAQLSELCTGQVDVPTLLQRQGVGPETPEKERIRARDRLYQVHRRLRQALLEAIDRLELEKKLSSSEADLGRSSLRTLLMQTQRASSVR